MKRAVDKNSFINHRFGLLAFLGRRKTDRCVGPVFVLIEFFHNAQELVSVMVKKKGKRFLSLPHNHGAWFVAQNLLPVPPLNRRIGCNRKSDHTRILIVRTFKYCRTHLTAKLVRSQFSPLFRHFFPPYSPFAVSKPDCLLLLRKIPQSLYPLPAACKCLQSPGRCPLRQRRRYQT